MKLYAFIWIALLILTAATVGSAQLDLGPYALAMALLIAFVKATLVALFFMHLWEQKSIYRVSLVTSFVFAFVLMGFTLLDVGTRYQMAKPQDLIFQMESAKTTHTPAHETH